ncbi:MAG: hypothetical protein ACR2QM_17410 [Longimicrobiales bacterium]
MVKKKRRVALAVIAIPLAALAGVLMGGDASPVSAEAVQECEARFSPTAVDIGEESVSLSVSFSEDIGALDSVEAEDGSGIQTEGFDPMAATLTLSTASGAAGTWSLTFTDVDGAKCAGTVTLVEGP